MLGILVKLLEVGIGSWFNLREKTVSSEVERDKIKAAKEVAIINTRASVLSMGGWKFQLFFIVPLGLWFSSVVIYSIFFHANGPFPQTWDIAALPGPLNNWAGIIIAYLFLVSREK